MIVLAARDATLFHNISLNHKLKKNLADLKNQLHVIY